MTVALRGLDSRLRGHAEQLVAWAKQNGVPVTVTSVFRSMAQQQALRSNYELCVKKGLTGKRVSLTPGMSCAWPANRPGDSGHNYGLAWDSVVPAEYQSWWNEVRRAAGWHVPANDEIHAEYPGWREVVG